MTIRLLLHAESGDALLFPRSTTIAPPIPVATGFARELSREAGRDQVRIRDLCRYRCSRDGAEARRVKLQVLRPTSLVLALTIEGSI